MNKFEENKYYICSGQGVNWGDYEGPFDTESEATYYLSQFNNPSPEMLRMVVTHFVNNQLHLVKRNGQPLNLALLLSETPANSRLLKLAEISPPPQSWYDENENLFESEND